MNPFIERHQDLITGTLSCFDRVILTGTLPDICYHGAMAGYLSIITSVSSTTLSKRTK